MQAVAPHWQPAHNCGRYGVHGRPHAACHAWRRVVKDTSSWTNKKELFEAEQASCCQLAEALAEVDRDGVRAKVQQASRECDEAQAACIRCVMQIAEPVWTSWV